MSASIILTYPVKSIIIKVYIKYNICKQLKFKNYIYCIKNVIILLLSRYLINCKFPWNLKINLIMHSITLYSTNNLNESQN